MVAFILLLGLAYTPRPGWSAAAPSTLQRGLRYFNFNGALLQRTTRDQHNLLAPVGNISPKTRPDATPLRGDAQRLRKEKLVVNLGRQWGNVSAGCRRGWRNCRTTMTDWEQAIETQIGKVSAVTHRCRDTREKVAALSGKVKESCTRLQQASSRLHR